MHAERVVLTTDEQGRLTNLPALPPNAVVEAIFLIEERDALTRESPRRPPASIAGKGKILGDILSPVVPDEDWDALK